jgi:hypothetical protein
LSQFACLLPSLERENLLFGSIPDELFTSTRVYSPQLRDETFVMDYDPEVFQNYIDQFLAGEWPVASEDGEATCP